MKKLKSKMEIMVCPMCGINLARKAKQTVCPCTSHFSPATRPTKGISLSLRDRNASRDTNGQLVPFLQHGSAVFSLLLLTAALEAC
jgi:hypothetical protein